CPELRAIRQEDAARNPVQASARLRPAQFERSRESGGAVRGRVQPGLVQAPAEGGGYARQVQVERADGEGRAGHRATSCPRPAARTTSWSSLYLRTEPSVRSAAASSSSSTPSRSRAATQSIAS